MSRTMKQDAGAFRVVTKSIDGLGMQEVLGPFSTIGAAKSSVKNNCYRYEWPRGSYYVQTRQWFIERMEPAWVQLDVKLVDGEWV